MSILTDVNTHNDSQETAAIPSSQSSTKAIFTPEDIQKILPHRYPFALVDRIIEYVPGKRAVGIKNVTFNEPHFQGHFPGRPMMPGVMIVEAMAQVGGIVLTQMQIWREGYLYLWGLTRFASGVQ